MKKICFLFVIFIFAIVACKGNQKPKNSSVTRDPPPSVPAGLEKEAAYRDIYDKLPNYIKENNNWKSDTLLKGNFNSIKNKTLIYYNGGQWIVLGVADNGQDVFVGTSTGTLDKAAQDAAKESNWDSRKLFFYTETGGNIHFSWSARIGKPNASTFTRFTGFDAKGGIPAGHDAQYTSVQDFDQVFLRNINGVNYYDKLTAKEKENNGNNDSANFIIEKQGNTVSGTIKRKAWMWNFWTSGSFQTFDANGVRIVKPSNLRFGYTSSTGNTWYPGSTGTASSQQLTDLTASSVSYNNTMSPVGKTIFTRSINHEANNWNYAVNQAVFLATVVGYNVRMRTVTPRDIGGITENLMTAAGWTLDTQFEIVLIEFSDKAYEDAKFDNWNNIQDAPKSSVDKQSPLEGNQGAGSGNENYRVYFIVGKK